MKFSPVLAGLFCLLLLTACGTTDSQMQQQGRSQAYITGFHDGRHSGMKEEGNNFEHFIRDEARYNSDLDYRTGWDLGEAEGKHLQDQATAIGTGVATGMTASSISREVDHQNDPDRAAKKVLKNTDTTDLKSLEQ